MTFNYVSHSMMEYIVGKLKTWATAAFDAAGAAGDVLGDSNDTAADNTVYGAKAAAAAVLGASGDAASANTVFGAKAYSDANKSDLLGTALDAASANTIYGAKAYADQVAAASVTAAYKPGGSKTAANIKDTTAGNNLLVAANEGKVYNLTDDLTIAAADKARFVENAEASYPAGTNVVVIEATPADNSDPQNPVAATYKFDLLPGIYNPVDIDTTTIDGWFAEEEAGGGE